MRKLSSAVQGYILIALAILAFWIGAELRAPLLVHHKILVAKPAIKGGGIFDRSVIFVFSHNVLGAAGLIVNKPSGGPVETDKTFVLHSGEMKPQGSAMMKEINLGLVTGDILVEKMLKAGAKPKWYHVTNGYAGWGARQLDREIRRGDWKVIDYNADLLMKTDRKKMWEIASKRPDAKTD